MKNIWSEGWRGGGNIFKRLLDWTLANTINTFLCAETRNIVLRYGTLTRIAEVGCGEGKTAYMVGKKSETSITMIDYDEYALKKSKKLFGSRNNVDYLLLDITKPLPFQDKYFDVAFNIGTIEHFEDPVSVVREMGRVSNFVVCAVPSSGSLYWKIGTLLRTLVEKDPSLWTEHTRYYYKHELRKIFEDAGLKNIVIKQSTLFTHPTMLIASGYSL